MSKLEFAIENFKNTQELIRFIDQKANILLAIFGVIFSVFLTQITDYKFTDSYSFFDFLAFVLIILIMILGIIEIIMLMCKVIIPRKANNYNNTYKSLFYYGHIVEMEKEDFITKSNDLDEKDMLAILLHQVYTVSKIAERKSKYYRISTFLLLAIVLLEIILVFVERLI